jgi:hypothetical protein
MEAFQHFGLVGTDKGCRVRPYVSCTDHNTFPIEPHNSSTKNITLGRWSK